MKGYNTNDIDNLHWTLKPIYKYDISLDTYKMNAWDYVCYLFAPSLKFPHIGRESRVLITYHMEHEKDLNSDFALVWNVGVLVESQ